jgi:hypothetical protein
MPVQNVLRQNKVAIYRLKRNYGLAGTIYRPDPDAYAFNVETGRQAREWAYVTIKRMIRLPAVIAKKFLYDLSFIAANKNFTYGGFFDVDAILFIIDRKDMGDFELDDNSFIWIENKNRYEVSKFVEVEELAAYMVNTKAVTGTLPVIESEPSPS